MPRTVPSQKGKVARGGKEGGLGDLEAGLGDLDLRGMGLWEEPAGGPDPPEPEATGLGATGWCLPNPNLEEDIFDGCGLVQRWGEEVSRRWS